MKIPVARALTLGLSVALAVGTAVYAQHAYTPADLEEGGRLFRANCSNCHGADGNGQLGAPLTTGKFKRASNEDEAARLVRAGIASVGMPAFNNISELQAGAILSFLRTSAATVATPDAPVTLGDAARGKAIFEG